METRTDKTMKEKAKELIDRFMNYVEMKDFYGDDKELYNAKQCALICVDESIKDLTDSLEIAKDMHPHAKGLITGSIVSWKGVYKEIENYE
jgi:hypothetical protein